MELVGGQDTDRKYRLSRPSDFPGSRRIAVDVELGPAVRCLVAPDRLTRKIGALSLRHVAELFVQPVREVHRARQRHTDRFAPTRRRIEVSIAQSSAGMTLVSLNTASQRVDASLTGCYFRLEAAVSMLNDARDVTRADEIVATHACSGGRRDRLPRCRSSHTRASIEIVKAVSWRVPLNACMSGRPTSSIRSSVSVRQIRPQPCRAMKAVVRSFAHEAGINRSLSFSRSSLSIRMTIRPVRASAIISSTGDIVALPPNRASTRSRDRPAASGVTSHSRRSADSDPFRQAAESWQSTMESG